MHSKRIGFIGGGNMANSLIGGLVATGHDPDQILVAEPDTQRRDALAADHGVVALADNADVAAQADILVLAVKPNIIAEAAKDIAGPAKVRGALVVSIAAGISLSQLRSWLGTGVSLVRAMPNTPSLIRQGMTGACIAEPSTAEAKRLATALLGAAGEVRWFADEADLDIVTAVSGSGPAYFFYLMEAMQQAARELGLDDRQARDLVLQTALGAARLALHERADAAELRARVTSPGGTTAAAIASLEADAVRGAIVKAVHAAHQRARELA